jgi:sugar (pentulose or hexulose) kinase
MKMASEIRGVALGLDVGTSGIRALAVTPRGVVLAEGQGRIVDHRAEGSIHEQDALEWWRAVCQTLESVLLKLRKGAGSTSTVGIAVTSTSGSLVLTDSTGFPVRPAILYDDGRGAFLADDLNRRFSADEAHFNSSFSLIKAAWVRQDEPGAWERVRHILHPADWLVGKLTGEFGTTDYSNALKLGYDPEVGGWSKAVSLLKVSPQILPRVVRPGTQVGTVSTQASAETGLQPGTRVVAGATDGMASLIASGASEPRHANSTLGTTIVWKVLSQHRPRLTQGMYCHRHPAGLWAPGAASNTGPGSLRCEDPSVQASEMDRVAADCLPSSTLCYLLSAKGERYPFLNSAAETFTEGKPASPTDWYAAQLQSLAFVERWGYERLEECAITVGDTVFSTGSAAASGVFSQLRANVLARAVARCEYPTSAFGAAILAATESLYGGDLTAAIRGMTRLAESYAPSRVMAERFTPIYTSFRAACARRGYA